MKDKKRTIYVRVPIEDARRIEQMLWRVGQRSFTRKFPTTVSPVRLGMPSGEKLVF